MKIVGAILLSLVVCFGCSSILPFQEILESYGPGLDSREFSNALRSVLGPDEEAFSALASWHPDTYGYENIGVGTIRDAAGVTGVLVATDTDVIFFVWNNREYAPEKTITRSNLKVVVVEALGESRRLVLVTEDSLNTFELVREGRRWVDTAGTEEIAALLASDVAAQ